MAKNNDVTLRLSLEVKQTLASEPTDGHCPCFPAGCKYNQVNSHFHCIREGCQFSFLLKHQMTSHARKHMRRMLGKNFDRVPSQVRNVQKGQLCGKRSLQSKPT